MRAHAAISLGCCSDDRWPLLSSACPFTGPLVKRSTRLGQHDGSSRSHAEPASGSDEGTENIPTGSNGFVGRNKPAVLEQVSVRVDGNGVVSGHRVPPMDCLAQVVGVAADTDDLGHHVPVRAPGTGPFPASFAIGTVFVHVAGVITSEDVDITVTA